jgi:predicted glycosyltransferase
MRIWYDACTGKHVRYGAAIAKRLEEKGHEIIFTTRKHPDTIPLAKYLGLSFEIVGKYSPRSKFSRLYESLKRQLKFCNMFKDKQPDLAISHRSVEQCRVAFGLGIPTISTHDTPHADAVNHLTLPLIDILVVSEAIPDEHLRQYPIKRVVKFSGVDEVAWIKNSKPKQKFSFTHPLIVVRQIEAKAAYAEDSEDITLKIAKKLSRYGEVVFLSRYRRKPIKNLTVPREFIDSVSLVAEADIVISVGGTIAREAALQGTPSIVIPALGYSAVNEYLHKKGFPIFTVKDTEIISYVKSLIGRKFDVKNLLSELENPVDVIEKLIEETDNNEMLKGG